MASPCEDWMTFRSIQWMLMQQASSISLLLSSKTPSSNLLSLLDRPSSSRKIFPIFKSKFVVLCQNSLKITSSLKFFSFASSIFFTKSLLVVQILPIQLTTYGILNTNSLSRDFNVFLMHLWRRQVFPKVPYCDFFRIRENLGFEANRTRKCSYRPNCCRLCTIPK